MKYKALRMLVHMRAYANTEKGERNIVRTLTAMSVVFAVATGLFVTGIVMR
jgi:hypothetical protein